MPKKRAIRHARAVVATVMALVVSPLLVAGVGVSAAQAEVPYVGWTAYLPGWTEEYIPSSENDCVAGRATCLKATRKEFGRILERDGAELQPRRPCSR